jgi:hypothetical protein
MISAYHVRDSFPAFLARRCLVGLRDGVGTEALPQPHEDTDYGGEKKNLEGDS